MIDHTTPEQWDDTIDDGGPTGPAGAETIKSYDIDGGVVFYGAENPLARAEASSSVRLDDCA